MIVIVFVVCVSHRPNGDSFYEYLLKMYVLWGDVKYWDMFMQSYYSVQVISHNTHNHVHKHARALKFVRVGEEGSDTRAVAVSHP